MARLYLIRRNIESFVGPMTAEDLGRAYKKMAFGLQDEVCGHAGQWVQLDDLNRIKKYYPEVDKIVREDMLQGWGMSDHTLRNDTRKKSSKSARSLGYAFAFLLVALVVFGLALYMVGEQKFSGKLKPAAESPNRSEMNLYVEAQDFDGLNSYITAHKDKVTERVSESRRAANEWLPFIRVHAFSDTGTFAPLTSKQLRGGGFATYAPNDCSYQTWMRWWAGSHKRWGSLLTGKKLMRKHWARILAWDPHWVGRREGKGWIWPQNYQTACLVMAQKALNDLLTDVNGLPGSIQKNYREYGYDQIKARLDWQVAAVMGNAPEVMEFDPESSNALNQLTCFESAPDLASLTNCRKLFRSVDIWTSYADERYAWNVVRIYSLGDGTITEDQLRSISEVYNRLPANDHFTRFDYTVEKDFIRELMQNSGEIEKARQKTESNHPFVKFAH